MRKSSRASLDAMLRHLAGDRDPQDFPSTAYERQALIDAAGKRGLIEWQKERRRYALTPTGWRRLRRGRGLGLTALAISAGAGAAIGAAALAFLWLPGDVSPRSAGDHGAPGPRLETAGLLAPAPPLPAATPVRAVGAETVPGVAPANVVGPPTVAEPPGPKPSDIEAASAVAKQPSSKKSHKSAGALRRHAREFARRYRDERFAGSSR